MDKLRVTHATIDRENQSTDVNVRRVRASSLVCLCVRISLFERNRENERLTTIFRNFDGLYSTIREMETAMVCVFCCDIYVLRTIPIKKNTTHTRLF